MKKFLSTALALGMVAGLGSNRFRLGAESNRQVCG